MTEGERMVWAAAYVAKRQPAVGNPPARVLGGRPEDSDAWRQYEAQATVDAIECAWFAVEAAREAVSHVREGWGHDSDVLKSLKDMLGDRDD